MHEYPIFNQGDLLIKQVQIMIISIIMDPDEDMVLKRGIFHIIVENVDITWGDYHVILGMIASN